MTTLNSHIHKLGLQITAHNTMIHEFDKNEYGHINFKGTIIIKAQLCINKKFVLKRNEVTIKR